MGFTGLKNPRLSRRIGGRLEVRLGILYGKENSLNPPVCK